MKSHTFYKIDVPNKLHEIINNIHPLSKFPEDKKNFFKNFYNVSYATTTISSKTYFF